MTAPVFQPWFGLRRTDAAGFPDGREYLLRDVRIPAALLDGESRAMPAADGLVRTNVVVRDGRLDAISADCPPGIPIIDLQGGMLWPAFVEIHTHLDKGHTLPRAPNATANVAGAVAATDRDRRNHWTAADVARRFEFSLRCAFSHGTAAMRTHLDCDSPQERISWPVFVELREAWAGRIDLQGVSLTMLDAYEAGGGGALSDLVAECGGVMGAITRFTVGPQSDTRLASALDALFALASERHLDVDLHVDETSEPQPNALRAVALAVLRTGFKGRVICGHCCSLALRPEEEARETIALVRDAGLCIVVLPLVNLHLQARDLHRTPRWRGVTPIRELRAGQVPVAISSDNCRDPFYSFGDFDPMEVFRESVRICHLDLEAPTWLQSVTRWPADIMRLPLRGRIARGARADLVAFNARSMDELLARPQSDRIVLRDGRPISTMPPDYRELDDASPGTNNHRSDSQDPACA